MTDGQDEDPSRKTENNLLPQWGNDYGEKNVFGFYVMLHNSAKNTKIDSLAKSQKHFWKVETADVNINLNRLQSNAIFNAKNEEYFDIPIYGDASGKSFSISFPAGCPYEVMKTEKESNTLRVWVTSVSGQQLPLSSDYSLKVEMTGGGQFDFLVTEDISVKCEYKPERSLKISVR